MKEFQKKKKKYERGKDYRNPRLVVFNMAMVLVVCPMAYAPATTPRYKINYIIFEADAKTMFNGVFKMGYLSEYKTQPQHESMIIAKTVFWVS